MQKSDRSLNKEEIMTTEAKRPLSPHLSIYRIQITSALSILHRISGVALFCGFISLLWWVVYLTYSANPERSWVWSAAATPLGTGFIILWSYALFFHMCTGIRHLFWDNGLGFELRTVTRSGWLAVIASILLTAVSWCLALGVGGM